MRASRGCLSRQRQVQPDGDTVSASAQACGAPRRPGDAGRGSAAALVRPYSSADGRRDLAAKERSIVSDARCRWQRVGNLSVFFQHMMVSVTMCSDRLFIFLAVRRLRIRNQKWQDFLSCTRALGACARTRKHSHKHETDATHSHTHAPANIVRGILLKVSVGSKTERAVETTL